jgi:hypothetical protein
MFGLKYPSVRWRAALAIPAVVIAAAALVSGHPLVAAGAGAAGAACLAMALNVWREIEH